MVEIQKDVPLNDLNTLGLPSIAPLFVNVTKREDLSDLYQEGFFSSYSPFILGGGSNIVLSEKLNHPVLKISISGVEILLEEKDDARIRIGAGENWHNFVNWAVNKGYGGVENLALIPGTVGAAPIQNIGAYGVEIKQVFESLLAFDMRDGTFKRFYKNQCKFGYRDSIFKRELKGKCIVVEVTLLLKHENHDPNITYSGLREALNDKGIQDPDIKDVFEAVVAVRRSKLPDPKVLGNAGSFFKNPIIEIELYEKLQNSRTGIPGYPVDDLHVKVPAGWLIEQAGWKGKQIGNVGTYKNQALVIVNHGNATGEEILNHAKTIQDSVRSMFGIELTPEVNIIN
ncbi:MAG: UDP-N-acetylmuramate dehydrogenase [Balneolaceae bacterium]